MKPCIPILIVLMLISTSFIGVSYTADKTSPISFDVSTLYVGGSGEGNYTKIQDAIDNASEKDTVFVYNGTYVENLIVDKSINLVGEDKNITVIDGNEIGNGVNISADWINISGFTIKNSGGVEYASGIYIYSDHNSIKDNNINDNPYGLRLIGSNNTIEGNNITYADWFSISLYKSYYNTITGNYIRSKYHDSENILLSHSNCNTISNNIITASYYDGISAWISNNNIIMDNEITSNAEYGIRFALCNDNRIEGNTFSQNGDGVYFDRSSKNTIIGNNFSQNGAGIKFYDSSNSNIITNNILIKDGLYIEESNNNTIIYNSFFNDGINLYKSYQNTIYNNTVNNKPLVYLENKTNTAINVDAGQIILVKCENITIQNQEISNTNCGIKLFDTDNCFIYGNRISHNGYGIFLTYLCQNNIISGNNITFNRGYGVIFQKSCYKNTLMFNNISNNDEGISLEGSNENIIKRNKISWNLYWGIKTGGFRNNITHNSIINNGGYFNDVGAITLWGYGKHAITSNEIILNKNNGIKLWSSNNNTIKNNNIAFNQENGISLYISKGNLIKDNNIYSNDCDGILFKGYITNKSCNAVIGNIISSNLGYGIEFGDYCSDNDINLNNFLNNSKNAYDKGNNRWDDGYPSGGNFWDDYNGTDADGDGIGDTPYLIPGGDNEDRYPLMEPWYSQLVEFVNPRYGYIHLFGKPIVSSFFDLITDTLCFGGFKSRPIQVYCGEGGPDGNHFSVRLRINEEDKGLGTWNSATKYFEWQWDDRAFGKYYLNVIARNEYGTIIGMDEIKVWNFCLFP